MTTVLDAIHQRRSIRKYTDEPVTNEQLRTILDAGRWAPSGLNYQPFRFLVLRPDDPRTSAMAELTKYAHVVRGAGALIGLFLDKESMYHQLKDHQAAGACLQNMMLAAHELGLGSVWLGQIMNSAPQVLEALNFSEDDYEFIAFLAIGKPAQEGSSSRKPLEEHMLEAF